MSGTGLKKRVQTPFSFTESAIKGKIKSVQLKIYEAVIKSKIEDISEEERGTGKYYR